MGSCCFIARVTEMLVCNPGYDSFRKKFHRAYFSEFLLWICYPVFCLGKNCVGLSYKILTISLAASTMLIGIFIIVKNVKGKPDEI